MALDNPGHGGERGDPAYVDVSRFGKHDEVCVEHLSKGRQVAASVRLMFREWTGRDGSKRSAHSVRGSVQFLGGKSDAEAPSRSEQEEMALVL